MQFTFSLLAIRNCILITAIEKELISAKVSFFACSTYKQASALYA